MRLYHGTSFAAFDSIRSEGIRPPELVGTDNWKHLVGSHPKCVYLTNSYPLQYLLNATRNGIGVIIEVETDLLEQRLLVPDQDSWAMLHGNATADNLFVVTEQCRDELDKSIGTDQWLLTLRHSGNCGYLGTIPVEAMIRAVIIDITKNRHLIGQLIQTILSHHRCLTRLMLGDEIGKELLGPHWLNIEVVDPEYVSFEKNEQEGEAVSAGEQGDDKRG